MSSEYVMWPKACIVCGSQSNYMKEVDYMEKRASITPTPIVQRIKSYKIPIRALICEGTCESILEEMRRKSKKDRIEKGGIGCMVSISISLVAMVLVRAGVIVLLGSRAATEFIVLMAVVIILMFGLIIPASQLGPIKNPLTPYVKIYADRKGLRFDFKNEAFCSAFSSMNPHLRSRYREGQL
jgi:hypothetical protein